MRYETCKCKVVHCAIILLIHLLSSQGFTPTPRTSSYVARRHIPDTLKQPSLELIPPKGIESNTIRNASLKSHAEHIPERSLLNRLRSFLFVLRRRWFVLRKNIRASTEKYTIYVLQCENGKYYVGSTANKKQRFKEHFQSARSGSKWTRMHKPLKVVKEYKRVSEDHYLGLEAKVTANLMWKHGVNNVRGAFFSHPRIYTQDDADALRGFLGHFNCLSFAETFDVLQRTLPDGIVSNTTTRSSQRTMRSFHKGPKASDRCHKCGGVGHWARDCPKGKVNTNLGIKANDVSKKDATNNPPANLESHIMKKSKGVSNDAFSTVSRDLAESALRIELERRVMKGPWDEDFDPNITTFQ